LWLWWSSGVLLPITLGLILDNSIWERFSEASSPKGDASLHLIAVAQRYWATGTLGLEIHSGPDLSRQLREKKALLSTMVTQKFCVETKEGKKCH
jgi:hypothetical protein